jgi:hypothetical protein
VIAKGAHGRLDLFAVRPVENNPGWFESWREERVRVIPQHNGLRRVEEVRVLLSPFSLKFHLSFRLLRTLVSS